MAMGSSHDVGIRIVLVAIWPCNANRPTLVLRAFESIQACDRRSGDIQIENTVYLFIGARSDSGIDLIPHHSAHIAFQHS